MLNVADLRYQVANADRDMREPLEPYTIEALFARRHILVTFKEPRKGLPKKLLYRLNAKHNQKAAPVIYCSDSVSRPLRFGCGTAGADPDG